jgi:hypothetical protein
MRRLALAIALVCGLAVAALLLLPRDEQPVPTVPVRPTAEPSVSTTNPGARDRTVPEVAAANSMAEPTTAAPVIDAERLAAVSAAPADDPLTRLDPAVLENLRDAHGGQGAAFDDSLREFLRQNPQALDMLQRGHAAGKELREAVPLPELPAPAAPAAAGTFQVSWDQYDSTITVADPGPDGRSRARVETYDRRGNLVVAYDASAYRDAAGNTQIDARGSPVEGPWAKHWSPDSFRIDPELRVHTIDDFHRGHDGSANPAGGG